VPARIAARRETSGVRTRAQSFVERGAYRLAHAVVANAGAIREQLVKEGVSREKIEVIYNSLDLKRYVAGPVRDDVLDSMALPRGLRYVTIVANMHHPVKDHPTFLRAARMVLDAVPEAGFALAGEGPLLESFRALAADLGLAERAFFLGRCTRVADLLAVSDVCVLASLAEGFPNAVLEYMASARPVVCTDVGGVREAISDRETGYLVAPGDFQSIAAYVISLLRNRDDACAIGRRARNIVEAKFSCEAQLSRTEALYARLLSGT
jgi:glycosyltransferase involved in cell wall biosynthesis